jgi:zinc protease
MRPSFLPALPLAALLLASAASAQRPSRAAAPLVDPAKLRIERHVLDNGLTVLMHEDHTVPTVTLWQWFKVGSRNEWPGVTGISHFFEHMMFNGSKNVAPKEYDRIIESNGGFSNAFTDRDMTAYYEDIASDRLDVLLRLDSDRMASLSLLPEQLESEIEVVKEERRLRTDNDIAGMLDEQLWASAFVASPYRWPVVGWMKDLEAITREDCVSYFRTYYAPNNCILVLVGDFEPRRALADIRAAFGSIPRQDPPKPPANAEPPQVGERRAEVHYPAQNVSVMMGWKAPAVGDSDAVVLDVLSRILSRGDASRLQQALVHENPIALDVSTYFQNRIDAGLFELYLELKPEKTAAEGEKAIDAVLKQLIESGPTAAELERAKNQLEAGFVRGLKTNNGIGEQIGYFEHVYGDHRRMFDVLKRWRAVTAADVKRVAKQTFDPLRRTVVTLVPQRGSDAAAGTP